MTYPPNVSSGDGNFTAHYPHLERAEQIFTDYIQPGVCIFGIMCNILNIIVLTRPKLKESPYTYLLGLAVADLGVLLMIFIRCGISRRFGAGVYGWQLYNGYIYLPFANMFSNASVWITVCLTIERWISVTFPLRAKTVCTKQYARKTMLGVAVVACIINVPRFFTREIVSDNQGSDGRVRYTAVSSDFEQSKIYETITWIYIACVHVVPYLTITVLNTCLLRMVYKANRDRAELNETNVTNNITVHVLREQRRLTVTCISIICLFLVCVVPTAFANHPVAYALFGGSQPPEEFFRKSFYRLLSMVTNTLLTCNLSLNFLLYCLFNQKFYNTLKHTTQCYLYRVFKIYSDKNSFHRLSYSDKGLNLVTDKVSDKPAALHGLCEDCDIQKKMCDRDCARIYMDNAATTPIR